MSKNFSKNNKIGKIITVTSGKGGVGKSTITANIGKGFSLLNYKTLLIDLDVGLKNLDILLNIDDDSEYDLIDLMNNDVSINSAVKKVDDNLFYLSAFQDYDKTFLVESKINTLFTNLKKEFDIIIIDSPAGIESGFLQSIEITENIVLVVNPDIASIRDTDKVIHLIKKHNKNINKDFEVKMNLIINKYLNTEEGSINIEDITSLLNLDVYGVIPYDEKMNYYYNNGIPSIIEDEHMQLMTKRLEESFVKEKNYQKIIEDFPIEDPFKNIKSKNHIIEEQGNYIETLKDTIEKQEELISLNSQLLSDYEEDIVSKESDLTEKTTIKEKIEKELEETVFQTKTNKNILYTIIGLSTVINIIFISLYILKG